MVVSYQINAPKLTFSLLLLVVCFLFVFKVDGNLLVDPALLGKELQAFAKDALGVDEMQMEFDRLQFTQQEVDGATLIAVVADKVASKFKDRFSVVRKLKAAAEASYARSQALSSLSECCKTENASGNLEYDPRFRQKVDLTKGCIAISGSAPTNRIYMDDTFEDDMKKILNDHPFIKWQYFGSEQGVLTNFPAFQLSSDCSTYDPRFRPWYVETATPEPNDVVLVIDTSGSMAGSRIQVAKDAAVTVLSTLNPRDRVGIVSFNTDSETPGSGRLDGKVCYSQGLADAIPINLEYLQDYVRSLQPGGGTFYGKAFAKAFDLLKSSYLHNDSAMSLHNNSSRKKVILFLTDGKPSDDKPSIMKIIKDENAQLNNSVIILTYGMLVNEKILLDIANQDGTSYGVPKAPHVTPGKFTSITNTNNLRSAMATYYDFFARNAERNKPIISIPYVDAFGSGLLTTISLPCYHDGKFIGVVGTDLSMGELLSEITYFREGRASYAFMAERSGRAMMHPLLPAPSDVGDNPIFMDIRDLEPDSTFNSVVYDSMKRGGSGNVTYFSKRYVPRGGKVYEGVTVLEFESNYFWRPVEETDFTVGIVVAANDKSETLTRQSVPTGFQFLYHRLDLQNPSTRCVNFERYAVKNATVVKFSPDAFDDPYQYLDQQETASLASLYGEYMTGKRFENPGFKDGIRDTVVVTKKVEEVWFKLSVEYSQYLVWRYMGTANGVFRLTPGVILARAYDPSKRPWYHTALSNTGLVALSTPYIDAFGAGVVITAAHTLYRGQSDHKHGTGDEVLGVLGADFPLSYFHKLLTDTYSLCEDAAYSCFVVDRAGFLIMHEDFLSPDITAATLEYIHITQKEKDTAEDLLLNGYLVKNKCRNLEKIKMENFYELNLPLEGVNTISNGQPCKKYQLSHIVGSNAFLGIILRESGCTSLSCTCYNNRECPKAQYSSCQCPCSSTLDFQYCKTEFPSSNISICPVPAAVLSSDQVNDPSTEGLEKCFDPECDKKLNSDSCDGVVGCYWCLRDKDNRLLSKQYCADVNQCYGGREGTRAPGSPPDQASPSDTAEQDNDDDDDDNNKLVIALCVAGGLIFVVVGAAIFYFKRETIADWYNRGKQALIVALRPPTAEAEPAQPAATGNPTNSASVVIPNRGIQS